MASGIIPGSFSGTSTNNVQPVLEWSSKAAAPPNNYSDVTVSLVFLRKNTSWGSWNANGHSVAFTINGNKITQSRTFDIRGKSREVVWTRTLKVDHNSDGKKSIAISASSSSTGTSLGSYSFSGTATLDTIPRASTLKSVGNFSIKDGQTNAFSLSLERESSSFTHNITLRVNGTDIQSWNGQNLPTSLTLSIESSNQILNILRNTTSMTAQLRVQTRNGSTNIGGILTRDATVSVHSSLIPVISSISVSEDVSDISSNLGVYVQYQSKLKMSVATSASYGARDGSVEMKVNGQTFNAKTGTTATLKTSGTNTISVKYTNTRGQTVSGSTTVTVYQYSNPQPRITDAYRSNANGERNDDGEYGTVEYAIAISSLNGSNSKGYQVRYKRTEEADFVEETLSSGNGSYTFPADVDYAYDIQVVASDHFSSIPAYTSILSTFSLINFASSGLGMAFGGTYDENVGGTLQVDRHNLPKVIFQHSANGGTFNIPIPERGIYLVVVSPSVSTLTSQVAIVNQWYESQMSRTTLNASTATGISITAGEGAITLSYSAWFTMSVIKLGN
ncbi:hypothetical protein ACO1PF_00460 [Alkalibacterium sp. f15]|uniref:hypothetical protein n=1 Tax=Alkalibacterium sp. f15 TaxID=3414029 RepID=UPI003BF81AD9